MTLKDTTMGWFIRSPKKSTKRSGASKVKHAWQKKQKTEYDPQRTWRVLRNIGMVAGAIVLIVGAIFGQRWLVADIARSQAAIPQVALLEAPRWMRPSSIEEIRQLVAVTVDPNPLNQQSLDAAARALGKNAWIEQVQRVTRRYDGRIEVRAVYRTPVALIRARDGFHLVDAAGTKLPGVYPFDQLEMLRLPVITGVQHAPPAEGWRWSGDDARAGLAMAILLGPEPLAQQVKAIDVSNFAGRRDLGKPQIKLLTNLGSDGNADTSPGIGWGRAPGNEGIYEPPAAQKVLMLRRVMRQYGAIDAGGQVVDVFTDTPMIHPIAGVRYTSVSE